jgi:hypothetical protein
MWDTTMTAVVGVLLFAVLVIAALSLVALPALIVGSWIQRRRSADPDR